MSYDLNLIQKLADMEQAIQDLKKAQSDSDIGGINSSLPSDTALPSTIPPQGVQMLNLSNNLTYISDGTIMRGPQLDSGTAFPSTTNLPTGYHFARTDLYQIYFWDGAFWRTGQDVSGTAFPASPPTNYLFYRTDLGVQAQYDGTRWLGPVTRWSWSRVGSAQPVSVPAFILADYAKQSMVIVSADLRSNVQTTNSSVSYWTMTLMQDGTVIGTAANTSADAAGAWVTHTWSISNLLITGGNSEINIYVNKAGTTGTPGAIYVEADIRVRYIYT